MYDLTMAEWTKLRDEQQLRAFYSQPFLWRHLSAIFDLAHRGCIDTWDIQWMFSCIFNNGLSVIPRVNLISNIGLVGTHTNGDLSNNHLPVFPIDMEQLCHPAMVYPDHRFDNAVFTKLMKPTVAGFARKVYFALLKRFRKMWRNSRS